jgi:hypothetical protein
MPQSDESLCRVMPQRFHPHHAVGGAHARVPGDDCAGVVAARSARGAVGHDLHANAARHEAEGAGGTVDAASVVVGALKAARQSPLIKHFVATLVTVPISPFLPPMHIRRKMVCVCVRVCVGGGGGGQC